MREIARVRRSKLVCWNGIAECLKAGDQLPFSTRPLLKAENDFKYPRAQFETHNTLLVAGSSLTCSKLISESLPRRGYQPAFRTSRRRHVRRAILLQPGRLAYLRNTPQCMSWTAGTSTTQVCVH